MKTSAAGLAALKAREGCKLVAYKDSAGVPTIGYGSTLGVKMGMKITQDQAEALLIRDLVRFEKAVNEGVTVPLNGNEFDALVSFAFNVGVGAFQSSTLLKELNKGNRYGAANQFLLWDKITVKGKKVPLKGLTVRRKAERDQFLGKSTSGLDPKPIPPAPTRVAPAGNWLSTLPASLLKAIAAFFGAKA